MPPVDYNPGFKADLSTHFTKNLTSGDAPFGCPVPSCRAVFKTNTDLKRHNKVHTGEKPYQARKIIKRRLSYKNLPCFGTGSSWGLKSALMDPYLVSKKIGKKEDLILILSYLST
jgi:hypothetical protein